MTEGLELVRATGPVRAKMPQWVHPHALMLVWVSESVWVWVSESVWVSEWVWVSESAWVSEWVWVSESAPAFTDAPDAL